MCEVFKTNVLNDFIRITNMKTIVHPSLGTFNILDEIGRGTFSTVLLAEHAISKAKVALKIFKQLENSSEIEREMKIIQSIDHPFIMSIYDKFDYKGHVCFITELIEGDTLLDYVNSRGKLNESKARIIFAQMIMLIEYLHEKKKIAHRDLKCENIMIDFQENAHLIDFGFSKCFQNDVTGSNIVFEDNIYSDNKSNNLLSTACGSPGYAAPEILTREPYDGPAVDIWSLGIILYAMTHGRLPFSDSNELTIFKKIMFSQPQYSPNSSTKLVDLLSKMLSKDPKRRISIEGIKQHPWITTDEAGNSCVFHYSILDMFSFQHDIIDAIDMNIINTYGLMAECDVIKAKRSIHFGEKTPNSILYSILRKHSLLIEISPKFSGALAPASSSINGKNIIPNIKSKRTLQRSSVSLSNTEKFTKRKLPNLLHDGKISGSEDAEEREKNNSKKNEKNEEIKQNENMLSSIPSSNSQNSENTNNNNNASSNDCKDATGEFINKKNPTVRILSPVIFQLTESDKAKRRQTAGMLTFNNFTTVMMKNKQINFRKVTARQ